MPSRSIAIFTILLIMILSCKKETPTVPTPDSNSITLSFDSLVAEDTITKVQAKININAYAKGEDVVYSWTSTGYLLPGTGQDNCLFTICHAGTFNVVCTVKDKYNASITKTIYIKVNDLKCK